MATDQQPPKITQDVSIRIKNVLTGSKETSAFLAKLQKSLKQIDKSINHSAKAFGKLNHALKNSRGELGKTLKLEDKLISSQTKQQKAFRKSELQAGKLAKAYKKMGGAAKDASKGVHGVAAGGGAGGGGGGGGGIHLGLPAFLSVAAISAATVAMARYVSELARARDMAAGLAGGRRLGLSKRDSELFSGFATQRFSNRFLSGIELKGLTQLRSRLQEALGEEAGKELTLKLTEGFKSAGEQAAFLATASKDVVQALRSFQSVSNIEDFALALSAATMKTDALSRTASTLEKAWRDVQDTFEGMVTSFVDANEGDLKTVIGSISQGIVNIINWGRRLASEMKPVFSLLISGFKQVSQAVEFWQDPIGGGRANRWIKESVALSKVAKAHIQLAEAARARGDMGTYQQEAETARKIVEISQSLASKANDYLSGPADLTLKIAENVELIKVNTEGAVAAAEKERQAFEKTRTAAEQAALAIERGNEQAKLEMSRLDLIRARLARFEESPLGFGSAYAERLKAAEQINKLVEINRQQQEELAKSNMSLTENQQKMLELQTEENNLLAEKMRLLKQTQRGYLDAITAQAFGAGKFQKIIYDQDNAIALALEKGVAKRNPLLGLVGEDAARNKVDPFRWTGAATKDAAGLARYHEQLGKMLQGFVDDLRDVLIPPVPRERIDIAGDRPQMLGRGDVAPARARAPGVAQNLVEQAKEMLKQSFDTSKMWARFVDMLASLPEETETVTFRPTRSGGRTALGGPGS